MKLDTSSYYPKSPLDDDDDFLDSGRSESPVEIHEESVVADPAETARANFGETVAAEHVIQETGPEDGPDLPQSELEKFLTNLSHILSWALVPLLMPVYGVMLAFGLSILSFTPFSTRLVFTLVVAGINLLIPAVSVLLLKKFGVVQDVGLNGRRERFFPYIVTILCLMGTACFMAHKGAPLWLVLFFLGGASTGLVELIVNRWWKISAHAAGMAGVVALLVHLFMGDFIDPATEVWLLIAVGLSGLLGSARIWLGRHTLGQVLAGYAVGFCAVFFMMMVR